MNVQTNAIIRAIDNCLRYGKIIVVVTNDLSFHCYIIVVQCIWSLRSVMLVIFNQQRIDREWLSLQFQRMIWPVGQIIARGRMKIRVS